jgi:Flp pilus assembly protein TadG
MARRPHKRIRALGKRGTAAIEYAIIAPVLFLFLLGIVDMGRLMWIYTGLYRGAEAGARCGGVNTTACATNSQIQSVAAGSVWGTPISTSVFRVSSSSCSIKVTANYNFKFYTPGFSSITLAPSARFVNLQGTVDDDECSDD